MYQPSENSSAERVSGVELKAYSVLYSSIQKWRISNKVPQIEIYPVKTIHSGRFGIAATALEANATPARKPVNTSYLTVGLNYLVNLYGASGTLMLLPVKRTEGALKFYEGVVSGWRVARGQKSRIRIAEYTIHKHYCPVSRDNKSPGLIGGAVGRSGGWAGVVRIDGRLPGKQTYSSLQNIITRTNEFDRALRVGLLPGCVTRQPQRHDRAWFVLWKTEDTMPINLLVHDAIIC
ncbi:hypothetical protein KQX54_016991 [Cotesia glomerata]|uniref:Uncharacterized protein n=1 Tax=Cotesia glomerata TaxID=32391 RepID=A0AAV7I9Y0_COTGL|nr:hypothetical protein KQX54_016991 [Cotesia glomerata]